MRGPMMEVIFCLILFSTAFYSNTKTTQSPRRIRGSIKPQVDWFDSSFESQSAIKLKRNDQYSTSKIKNFKIQNKKEMTKSESRLNRFRKRKRKRKTDALQLCKHQKRSFKGTLKGKNNKRKKQLSTIKCKRSCRKNCKRVRRHQKSKKMKKCLRENTNLLINIKIHCQSVLKNMVKQSGKQRVLKKQKLLKGNNRFRNQIRKTRGQPLSCPCSCRNQEADDKSEEERKGEEEKCEVDIDVEESIVGEEETEEEQRGEKEKGEEKSEEKDKCKEAIDVKECIAKEKETDEEQRGEQEKGEETRGEKEKCKEAIDIEECKTKEEETEKEQRGEKEKCTENKGDGECEEGEEGEGEEGEAEEENIKDVDEDFWAEERNAQAQAQNIDAEFWAEERKAQARAEQYRHYLFFIEFVYCPRLDSPSHYQPPPPPPVWSADMVAELPQDEEEMWGGGVGWGECA